MSTEGDHNSEITNRILSAEDDPTKGSDAVSPILDYLQDNWETITPEYLAHGLDYSARILSAATELDYAGAALMTKRRVFPMVIKLLRSSTDLGTDVQHPLRYARNLHSLVGYSNQVVEFLPTDRISIYRLITDIQLQAGIEDYELEDLSLFAAMAAEIGGLGLRYRDDSVSSDISNYEFLLTGIRSQRLREEMGSSPLGIADNIMLSLAKQLPFLSANKWDGTRLSPEEIVSIKRVTEQVLSDEGFISLVSYEPRVFALREQYYLFMLKHYPRQAEAIKTQLIEELNRELSGMQTLNSRISDLSEIRKRLTRS